MARAHGLRFGLIAAVALTMGTMATTTATAETCYRTDAGTASVQFGYDDQILMIVVSADLQSDFALPALDRKATLKRDFPAYSAPHRSERASRSAVRPTAVSGWRSGRVRHLAG